MIPKDVGPNMIKVGCLLVLVGLFLTMFMFLGIIVFVLIVGG